MKENKTLDSLSVIYNFSEFVMETHNGRQGSRREKDVRGRSPMHP